MPRLVDSIALTLVLSACSPAATKSAINGGAPRMPFQAQTSESVTEQAPSEGAKTADTPDGYGCENIQNSVKNDVTRCCLTINPYKACHDLENSDLGSFSKANTINIDGRIIPNYTQFKEGIPPQVYLNYLAESANDAIDLAGAISSFIKYQSIDDDMLLSPEEIVSAGAGDCDNVSNLFVDELQRLGKKKGHDYKAKVIGLDGANHAVAVFLDTDGKWKALDFSLPFSEIGQSGGQVDLFSASKGFEKNKVERIKFYERKKLGPAAGKGARIDLFIDPETMMPTGKEVALAVDFEYNPNTNPDVFLKDYKWRQAELTHIHYKNDTTVYYRKGVLYQVTEKSKVTFYNENNVATEIQYVNHPEIIIEYFTETGQLERRDFKNGKSEIYKGGVLFQLLYTKGPVEYEVYHPSGALRQKNYRDGKTEWFDENGQLTHRKDQRGKVTVFRDSH